MRAAAFITLRTNTLEMRSRELAEPTACIYHVLIKTLSCAAEEGH